MEKTVTPSLKKQGYLAFAVDIESASNPYGEGTGYVLTVIAKSIKEARKKANESWRQRHPFSDGKAFKIRKDQDVVL